MPRRCPPGVWCLTPNLVFCILLCIGIFALILFAIKGSTMIVVPPSQKESHPAQVFNNIQTESRYSQAPEPLRFWQTGPDLRGAILPPGAIPINVSTRGLPQAFQQSGIIKMGEQILPLYGRQSVYSGSRFNYYTRTDSFNPVQVPIRYGRRDCMDDIGCDELLGGETVKVAGIGKEGSVEVYKFDGPKYIPGLV